MGFREGADLGADQFGLCVMQLQEWVCGGKNV
jgi:hypothetical protein